MPSKKWTYETCMKASYEFTALKDFRSKCPSAYNAALKNGWIKDYTWLKVCNNHGYWDYDKCFAEAKKYNTNIEFAKGCGSAHFRAMKNGWIKDYTWFVDGRRLSAQRRTKLDYDACYEIAKQCSKKSEMQEKNERAYRVALKNGWFSDYTWFLSEDVIRHQKRPSRVKWSYERCREFALQYNTLAGFARAYPSVYAVSNKNGWIEDFDWLGRSGNVYTSKIDNVYAYFFNELNSVYVGRTVNPSSRNSAHNTSENSTVFRFAYNNNTTIPKMTILESGLTITEGLDKEDYYCKKYQSEGWHLLNIAKTGRNSGAIGSLGGVKWNYKSCYKEAQQYETLKEFRKKSPSAYNVSRINKWTNDYVWLKRVIHKPNYWTYETCYKEAQQYETLKEFSRKSPSAYGVALKNKWTNDYVWLKLVIHKPNYWTYETCYKEAQKYETLRKFYIGSCSAYSKAKKEKWLDDYVWLVKKDISKKPVLQFSLDGKFIAKYGGIREACRINGFKTQTGILGCCKGQHNSCQGFIWKYA